MTHATPFFFCCFISLAWTTQVHSAEVSIVGRETTGYATNVAQGPEVHVVSIYEVTNGRTGVANVNVRYEGDSPMAPITLVLSSYESVEWQFNIDPAANVEAIALSGYERQTATGHGEIPVTKLGRINRGQQWPLGTGGGRTQMSLLDIESHFGTRVSSFTGAYQATDILIDGSPTGAEVPVSQGAGNLVDGPNPDLYYNKSTGHIEIDIADVAEQYPFGDGNIWWQHFDAQRMFVSLANHDGSFREPMLNEFVSSRLPLRRGNDAISNQHRLGLEWLDLDEWNGQRIGLGQLLPPGIETTAELKSYFASAHFATDHEKGMFDLFVVPESSDHRIAMFLAMFVWSKSHRRRGMK